MHVVLIRHGIAEEIATSPGSLEEWAAADRRRALTDLGRRRVQKAALGLRKVGFRPTRIVHSGLLRAEQTATLLAERLLPRGAPLEVVPGLEPDADPHRFFAWLAQHRIESLGAVGHAPNLDRIVALACGATGRLLTELGKAAAIALEVPDSGRPAGRLLWLLPPKLLRRLARS